MTVNAITDTKKGEQGLRLLIFILPRACNYNTVYKCLLTYLLIRSFGALVSRNQS